MWNFHPRDTYDEKKVYLVKVNKYVLYGNVPYI